MKDTVQIMFFTHVAESKESGRKRARLRKSGRDLCSRLSEGAVQCWGCSGAIWYRE